MSQRLYSIVFTAVSVTALQDLFMIAPATNRPISIHSIFVGQSSDVGDAEEEQLRLQIIRGNTTVGSGGTSVTPNPLDPLDVASGATCRVNDTTVASAGTPLIMHAEPFNVRTGYTMIFPPEMRIKCSATQTRIVVRLMANPADALTMSGTLYFEEL